VFIEELGHPEGHPTPPGRWNTQTKVLPLTLEIRTPDGELFTADQVKLNDINRFRDLRGISQGFWTYRVFGESAPIQVFTNMRRVTGGNVRVNIRVDETVTSKSAGPLVDENLATSPVRHYTFDLYRVGTFTAITKYVNSIWRGSSHRPMRLIDPDGTVVSSSNTGKISYFVTLRTRKISAFLKAINKEINSLEEKIIQIELFKKGLLQKMFC
jgi:hypothetical protein